MSAVPEPAPPSYRHYQFLGGVSLLALFILQLQQNGQVYGPILSQCLLVLSAIMLLCGGIGLSAKRAVNPLIALLALGAIQILVHMNIDSGPQRRALLKPSELAMAMAALGYVASHYRLLSLRFHALPIDRRRGAAPTRPDRLATPVEVVFLIAQLPLFTLLACAVYYLLMRRHALFGLPLFWSQFLAIAWVLTVALFTAAHLFRHWQRRRMGRSAAQLLLQDALWSEIGGESRRMHRWLAWHRSKAIGS